MKTAKMIQVAVVVLVVAIIASVVYLQSEINSLRNNSPPSPTLSPIISTTASPSPTVSLTPSPLPSATTTPLPTQTPPPISVTSLNPPTISTTHDGTTLFCSGSLYGRADSGGIDTAFIGTLKISNVGAATAYNVNLSIRIYNSDGTQDIVGKKTIDASGLYKFFSRPVPLTIAPGQTVDYNSVFPGHTVDDNEVWGVSGSIASASNYVIVPVWSGSP
jgi:hypothetical protein